MQKLRLIFIIAFLLVLIGALSFLLSTPKSRFEGKTASVWFGEFCSSPAKNSSMNLESGGRRIFGQDGRELEDKPMIALRAMPSESVNYLSWVLRRRETILTRTWRKLWVLLPGWVRNAVPGPVDIPSLHWNAAIALSGLGTNAQTAVSDLVNALDQPGFHNLEVPVINVLRNCALKTDAWDVIFEHLSQHQRDVELLMIVEALHPSSRVLSQAFITIIQRGDAKQYRRAAALLANENPNPDLTLDIWKAALTNSDFEIRYSAVNALEKMGTNALLARRELEKAARDENSMVQTVARRILERFGHARAN